jgi:hypothetical protein
MKTLTAEYAEIAEKTPQEISRRALRSLRLNVLRELFKKDLMSTNEVRERKFAGDAVAV